MPASASVPRSVPPTGAVSFRSSLTVITTSPVATSFARAAMIATVSVMTTATNRTMASAISSMMMFR